MKREDRKTTWEGWAFIIAWVFIIAAAILYGISEYTVDPHKGQVQENWAIGLFLGGLAGILGLKVFLK